MISKRHKFIFIHVPKTGGNAVQSCLERHSNDRKTTGLHQDGVERFGISGHITRKKHETLDHYARFVQIEDYTVVSCRRHPVDRLISAYFTPSVWHQQKRDGTWRLVEPVWDRDRFLQMDVSPASDFFKIRGVFRVPDVVLRFERLQEDFHKFCDDQGIPAEVALPTVNASVVSAYELERARADPLVEEMAVASYREDYENFGFEIPPATVSTSRPAASAR